MRTPPAFVVGIQETRTDRSFCLLVNINKSIFLTLRFYFSMTKFHAFDENKILAFTKNISDKGVTNIMVMSVSVTKRKLLI